MVAATRESPCDMARILALLGVFVSIGTSAASEKLVEALRRQLMQNNYDYMEVSGDSDQITTQRPDEAPVLRARSDELDDDLRNELDSRDVELDSRLDEFDRDLLSRRSNVRGPHSEATIPVGERDLHYYMNDERFSAPRLVPGADSPPGTAPTTVRYKVLEVRGEAVLSGRRRGGGGGGGAAGAARRRFLQEERPDHIAIVPLDDGPIPEFRLPRSRRQYMGEWDSDEPLPELPPLPGLVEDPTPPTPPTTPDPRWRRAPRPDSSAHSSHEHDPRRKFAEQSFEDDLIYLTQ